MMQTVNIAELKNNLSAYLEQVKNGVELIVKDRNRPVARLVPLTSSDDFLALPAPQVALAEIQAVIRAERDED
jgi:prevent-host-death family protein